MQLDKAIKERKSVRKFMSKKPDWRKIIEAVDFALHAPTAGNIHTTKFILVDDPKKIGKLAESCQQDFVGTAHYVVVVCSEKKILENAYGKDAEKYSNQQAGAAMQNFFLKIHDLGLSTCWVGYFVERMVKQELRIPENIDVEAILPIGYEAITPKQKSRKKPDLDGCLYFNKYKNKFMKEPKRVD